MAWCLVASGTCLDGGAEIVFQAVGPTRFGYLPITTCFRPSPLEPKAPWMEKILEHRSSFCMQTVGGLWAFIFGLGMVLALRVNVYGTKLKCQKIQLPVK